MVVEVVILMRVKLLEVLEEVGRVLMLVIPRMLGLTEEVVVVEVEQLILMRVQKVERVSLLLHISVLRRWPLEEQSPIRAVM